MTTKKTQVVHLLIVEHHPFAHDVNGEPVVTGTSVWCTPKARAGRQLVTPHGEQVTCKRCIALGGCGPKVVK